ncbi:MAG: DUF4348 domain-containing protein [Aureispira sp.]|nr:DUF4348 domain-containing protein [Aureispira sp.]
MYKIIFSLFIGLFLVACGNTNGELPKDENGNEDFNAFYQKFYEDSLFQFTRIEFPMMGKDPKGGDERFFWTEENWSMQNPIDPDNDPELERKVVNQGDFVQEKLLVSNSFLIDRYYSLVGNKWYMTYYSGLQAIPTREEAQQNAPVLDVETADSVSVE